MRGRLVSPNCDPTPRAGIGELRQRELPSEALTRNQKVLGSSPSAGSRRSNPQKVNRRTARGDWVPFRRTILHSLRAEQFHNGLQLPYAIGSPSLRTNANE